jgi:DNA-binding GntR family transcriptional regulator
MSINRDAPEPLYRQLAAILRTRINSGELQGRVPGIPRLAVEYDVAEMTVRHAINLLKDEGILVSVPGRGTFVAHG